MGQKYSTVYQHNTQSSYQSNNYDNTVPSNLEDIEDVKFQLGDDCELSDKYPNRLKCKLCYQSMYQKPTIMIKCEKFNHRYHTFCISSYIRHSDRRDVFKCAKCRDILSKYVIYIGPSMISN